MPSFYCFTIVERDTYDGDMISPRVQQRRKRLLPWRLQTGLTMASVAMHDVKLWVDVRDSGCGLIMYLNEEYEPAEVAWFQRTIQPGMVVIDVGAHVGYFTTLAARLVGSTGRVIAVEPDPYNFQLLSKNIRRNTLQNVQAFPLALGEVRGSNQLWRSPTNYGDHRLYADQALTAPITVATATLDGLLQTLDLARVDVIKIDVQGYEPYVLAGARQTLVAMPGVQIMTEFWPYGLKQAGSDPAAWWQTLTDQGFQAALLHGDGTPYPVTWQALLSAVPTLSDFDPAVFVNLIWHHE